MSGIGHTYSGGLVQAKLIFFLPQVMDLEQRSLTPPITIHPQCPQTLCSGHSNFQGVRSASCEWKSCAAALWFILILPLMFVSAWCLHRMNKRDMLQCWYTRIIILSYVLYICYISSFTDHQVFGSWYMGLRTIDLWPVTCDIMWPLAGLLQSKNASKIGSMKRIQDSFTTYF